MDSEKVMTLLTLECRDLLDLVQAPGDRDQIVRDHFETDLSGYGIPIEEWFDDLTMARRREIVNEALTMDRAGKTD